MQAKGFPDLSLDAITRHSARSDAPRYCDAKPGYTGMRDSAHHKKTVAYVIRAAARGLKFARLG